MPVLIKNAHFHSSLLPGTQSSRLREHSPSWWPWCWISYSQLQLEITTWSYQNCAWKDYVPSTKNKNKNKSGCWHGSVFLIGFILSQTLAYGWLWKSHLGTERESRQWKQRNIISGIVELLDHHQKLLTSSIRKICYCRSGLPYFLPNTPHVITVVTSLDSSILAPRLASIASNQMLSLLGQKMKKSYRQWVNIVEATNSLSFCFFFFVFISRSGFTNSLVEGNPGLLSVNL